MAPRSRHKVEVTGARTRGLLAEISQYLDPAGYLSWSARRRRYTILGTGEPDGALVPCPECRAGKLVMIRSPRTRKRFIGCSNYRGGCKASSPLPQRAMLRATKSACAKCGWPVAVLRYARSKPWTRKCSNIRCGAVPQDRRKGRSGGP